jgi:TrkA domain protein
MNFKETDLPGIGKKYSVETMENQLLSVVIHLSGKREVLLFNDPDEDPDFHFLLSDEEAGLVGSVLMGTYFKPEQEQQKELFLNKMSIEWVRINEECLLADKTIIDLEIRKTTGVTIIAIVRENDTIINPPPDTVFKLHDMLVVVGSREQTKRFNILFKTLE